MPRAPEDILETLHAVQAQGLLDELRAYQNGERFEPKITYDKDGKELPSRPLSPPPALFAQINKFLKDNGIDRAVTPGDPTSLLDEEVPVFDNVIEGDFK